MTLHIDFTDFGDVVRDVRLELPGVPDASIADMAAMVVAEFCRETQAYREYLVLPAGLPSYDLIAPHSDAVIIGLASVEVGEQTLLPGEYQLQSPDLIEFPQPLTKDARLLTVLCPLHDAKRAPATLMERWRQVIGIGVKARFMLQPNLSWSNPSMGGEYRREFLQQSLAAAADVRNQFSVSRLSTTPYTMNVYY